MNVLKSVKDQSKISPGMRKNSTGRQRNEDSAMEPFSGNQQLRELKLLLKMWGKIGQLVKTAANLWVIGRLPETDADAIPHASGDANSDTSEKRNLKLSANQLKFSKWW